MAGLSAEGLTINRLPDIITELKQQGRVIFQDLVPEGDVVNTEDDSLLGRMIGVVSPAYADLWEAVQQVYDAFTSHAATGIALDNVVQYAGITRFQPSASTASCVFTGTPGTVIPTGSLIKSPTSRNVFATTTDLTIGAQGSVGIVVNVGTVASLTGYTITYEAGSTTNNVVYNSSASATQTEILEGLEALIASSHPLLNASIFGTSLIVERANIFSPANFSVSANLTISEAKKIGGVLCTELGPQAQEANSLTIIATPTLGWTDVTNPVAAVPGRLVESDDELRARFRNTKFERSTNILDSLYSALANIDSVNEVKVYENDTDTTDSHGIPPHSFMVIIVGGGDEEIAAAIWKNKPMGILSYGNTTIPTADSQQVFHDISFERATPVPIYIEFEITTDSDVFPGDGVEQIKNQILAHAAANIGIGDTVIFSRLFTPINNVPGHYVSSPLSIGTSPLALDSLNIDIAFNEIATFSAANINISVV